MSVKIDKNVKKKERNSVTLYPWEKMAVGDSFRSIAGKKTSAYNIAKAASYRFAPKKFTASVTEDGEVRIWRDA